MNARKIDRRHGNINVDWWWAPVTIGANRFPGIVIDFNIGSIRAVPSCTYSTFAEATFALIFDQILPSGS